MNFASELLKLRSLPTPKMIAAVCLGLTALVTLIVVVTSPSDPEVYREGPRATATVATMIGALVFGAWMFGLDFAQGTLRRTLATEPRRWVVLANKGLVTVLATAGFSAVSAAFGAALSQWISSSRSIELAWGDSLDLIPSLMIQATLVALIAGAVTLFFRSFVGGLVAAFALLFVVDGVLGIWEAIRDYTISVALADIDITFSNNTAEPTNGLAPALLIAFAWIAAIAVPGVIRFLRADFK
ncbi:MAG: hypothetical protein WAP35_09980 [Solirubrobacterales bacterium]